MSDPRRTPNRRGYRLVIGELRRAADQPDLGADLADVGWIAPRISMPSVQRPGPAAILAASQHDERAVPDTCRIVGWRGTSGWSEVFRSGVENRYGNPGGALNETPA